MAGDAPHGTEFDDAVENGPAGTSAGGSAGAATGDSGLNSPATGTITAKSTSDDTTGDTPGGADGGTDDGTGLGSSDDTPGGAVSDTSRAAGPAEPAEGSGRQGRTAGLWVLVRRNPIFSVILVIAALLRAIAMIGYQPAMFFNDSFDYLHVAMKPYPHPLRPDGYSFLLLILKPLHSFALVTAVQHLMGLAMGVMIYALLRRRLRLPGWGAALAAAPVLLDAYQIQLEHLILSDTMFTFLVMSAITLLLWRDQPSWKISAAVGLIIGMSWLTRSVGLPVLVGVLVYLLIRRAGWRTLAVTLAACMLPVVAYMGWYKVDSDKFAITESNGIFLYARVYKFADCHKIDPPVQEMALCTEPQNRLPNSQDGIWNAASPLNRYAGKRFSPEANALGNDFAKRAILGQPDDYLRVVAHDFFKVFRWDRTVFPDKATYSQYEFGATSNPLPEWRMDADSTAAGEAAAYEGGRARTKIIEPFGGIIRGYQDHFFLRGTMLGLILLVGLAGLVPLWRRFGGIAFVPWTLATGLLLAPAATAEFDYRYVLPAVPLASLAAGMTFSPEARTRLAAMLRLRRRPSGAALLPDAPGGADATGGAGVPAQDGGTVEVGEGEAGVTGGAQEDKVPEIAAG
ncbi:hypothetical protein [Actinomadura xylanilytica]|uniref:hypothetical protein n=1 Tax=Actinomadura xylanilytica TaxID=887459 RepID=UPI00255A86A8|nr:hypothetical protein [Actinomadura xylanilytica]MDL4772380.1 hypothetical protein [Actinomadura xylanilytica]